MMGRSTSHACSTPFRAWSLLATVTLVLACPSDDVVQGDGSGTSSTTAGSSSGAAATTSGITSTSGPSGASSTGSTDPTAADSTGEPPPDQLCICWTPEPFGKWCGPEELAAWLSVCPDAQPCPRLTVECSRPAFDLYDCMTELVFDEAAMQCMLETLRDGTPSRLEIDGLLDYGLFSGQSLYLIHVLEGRAAMRVGCIQGDVGAGTFGPDSYVLAAPEYFTGCMDVADPHERYDCMMNGLAEEHPCRAAQAEDPGVSSPP
jgi:hypothetical protein